MLRGYNVPTTTKTTAEMSPLSALAGIGTGAMGLFSGTGTGGTGPSMFDKMKQALSGSTVNGVLDLGGGLVMGRDGSILGGSGNVDSGLSNADLEAQNLGYLNEADMIASGQADTDSEYYGPPGE